MEVDFRNTETVQPNTGSTLPVGNHVVRIEDASETESKNGHAGIEMQFTCDAGDIRDWRYISNSSPGAYAFTAGMVRQIAEACGHPCIELLEQTGDIPSQEWSFFIASLKNKTVGIIVREELGNDGKSRRKVQAYVDSAEFSSNGTTAAVGGNATVTQGNGSTTGDDSIPF